MATSILKTLDGATYTASPFFALAKGKICTLYCNGDVTQDYADGETILTLPEGMWLVSGSALDTQVFDVYGTYCGTIRIRTDGRVVPSFGGLKKGTLRFAITYIIR